MNVMTVLLSLNVLVLVALACVLTQLGRRLHREQALEQRVSQLREALGMLTDATESGFATLTSRLGLAPESKAPANTRKSASTRRVKAAARRGQSLAQVAAEEGISEGELHLRLSLADAARAAAPGVSRVPTPEVAAKTKPPRRRRINGETRHA
jgi:hypothetical protein